MRLHPMQWLGIALILFPVALCLLLPKPVLGNGQVVGILLLVLPIAGLNFLVRYSELFFVTYDAKKERLSRTEAKAQLEGNPLPAYAKDYSEADRKA